MIARASRLIFSATLFLLLANFSALAQLRAIPDAITSRIDENIRVTVPGSVNPLLQRATDLGSIPGAQTMNRMVLVLKRSDAQQTDLDTLLEAQQQKESPLYHKWLTPGEFQARFAPSPADVATVTSWLQSRGFSEITVSQGGQRVEFSGAVSNVESAFGTTMHQFVLKTASGSEKHVANTSAISLPQALSPVVAGLLSLNNFTSRPLNTGVASVAKNAAGKFVRTKGNLTTTDGSGDFSFFLAPGDVQKIYGGTAVPAGIDGTGTSIAVIGRTDVYLSDVQAFRKLFSLPQNDPNFIVSGPDPGLFSEGDAAESTLDLEWSGSVAPRATINFVSASSTDTTDGVALAAAYAVDNVISPILTLSYGECEAHIGPAGNAFWNALWQQAAAEGISALVSTGDGGAGICDADNGNSPAVDGDSVNGIASTPYNLAVGGTQFNEGALALQYWTANNQTGFSSANGYIPEAAWNQSCNPNLPKTGGNCAYGQTYYAGVGGGGGRSSCSNATVDASGNVTCIGGYAKPSWQHGIGVPSDGVRDLPDVALNASAADDPYVLCFLASCTYTQTATGYSLSGFSAVGGTSVSSPVMASILALVEQQNGTFMGQPNYTLYNLAAQANSSCSSSSRTDPTQSASCIFNDVTVGNIGVPGLPGYGTATADFTAAAGYDLATGLGSVNIANLVSNWKSGSASTATTTALTTTVTTAMHGTAIPLKIAVTSANGTPSGNVALETGTSATADQLTLAADGTYTGQIKDLPGGSYSLAAHYAGNGTYTASASTGTSLTISPEGSQPTLAVDLVVNNALVPTASSPYLGYQLYFKGSVAGLSGQGVPTGTVNVIVDGKTNVGSGTLTADGGILLSSQEISVGKHAVTLQYTGDPSFNASVSAPVTLTVGQGQTQLIPSAYGVPTIGYPAFLSGSLAFSGPQDMQPTGTIQLFDNGVAITPPTAIVYNGYAGSGFPQVNTLYTYTTGGPHVLTATYSGDSNYSPVAAGSSATYAQPITVRAPSGAPTVTSFKITSPTTLQQGQYLNFVATVAPKTPSSVAPTGAVYILNGANIPTISGKLVNGTVAGAMPFTQAGVYNIAMQYTGDASYAISVSSSTAVITVPKLTPVIGFTTSAGYVLPNTQVSLNFVANGVQLNQSVSQTPSGVVTFTDSVNGAAPVTLGASAINPVNGAFGLQKGYSGRFMLPAGSNVVTATYSGDTNFNAAAVSQTIVVSPPDFVFASGQSALTLIAGAPGSATLSLTPEDGYTGPVTLACAGGVPAGTSCVFSPASVTLGAAQTATLTLSVPAPSASAVFSPKPWERALDVMSLAGLILFAFPRLRGRPALLLLLLALMLPVTGCGGPSPSSASPGPGTTLISLSSSSTKVASGQSLTLSATLSALNSNPTGTVTFYDGSTVIGTGTLTAGAATLQVSSLAIGSHTVKAVYGGDSNNKTSTSTSITQVVTGTTNVVITATSGTLIHSVSLPVTLQ